MVKKFPKDHFSLICPNNDLESNVIIDIARMHGIHVVEHPGGWGAKLDLSSIPLDDRLQKELIIVELPNPRAESELEEKGHLLHVIDHHQYGDLDRTQSLSSLEQFAALIGHELTKEQWLVAINDRSFLSGLKLAGASLDEVLDIREKEREIVGISDDLFREAEGFWKDNSREFDDLICCLSPIKFSTCLAEAAQLSTALNNYEKEESNCIQHKPILAVYHDESDPSKYLKVELVGDSTLRDRVDHIITDSRWEGDFATWSGCGAENAFFGIKSLEGHPNPNWDGLLGQLFGALLVSGRPLVDYDATFLLPLDLHPEEGLNALSGYANIKLEERLLQVQLKDKDPIVENCKEREKDNERKADDPDNEQEMLTQSYDYFRTAIRDYLFQRETSESLLTDSGIIEYRLDKDHQFQIRLHKTGKFPEITGRIEALRLFRFTHNDLFILALRIKPRNNIKESISQLKTKLWWKSILHSDADDYKLILQDQVENWLHFTRLTRQLYLSFHEQIDENKFATISLCEKDKDSVEKECVKFESSHHFSPVINYLLSEFLTDESLPLDESRFSCIQDDRMNVSVGYALAGDGIDPESEEYRQCRRLFSLALYVDRQFDAYSNFNSHAYDPGFVDGVMKQDSYDRWNGIGTFMGFTSHSSVFMGVGEYFRDVITLRHVPHIYTRMSIVMHFYRASLQHYDRRIEKATRDLIANKEHAIEFRKLRSDFICFTNNYWFRELSPQMQGQDIGRHMHRALELDSHYELVKDEMERADEYLSNLHDKAMSVRAEKAGVIGLVLALVALVFAGIDVGFKGINPGESWLQYPVYAAAAIGFVGLLLGYFKSRD